MLDVNDQNEPPMLPIAPMSCAHLTLFYHFYHCLICHINYPVFSVGAAAL